MKEFINKLIGRLEELYDRNDKTKKIAYEEQDWETFDLFIYRCEGIYSAIAIVNELAEEYINTSTNTSSGWISVKDKLPTEEGSYLVVGKTGGATVTRWYMPNKFHPQGHFGGNSAEYIRYWMPRPQAPKYEPKENETLTNADRIRSMSDEELAEFISKYFSCEYECAVRDKCGSDWDCKRATIDWLQSEVEGVTENEQI